MAKKITKQYTGGWADPSISQRALNLLEKLGVESSDVNRVGELLGDYRMMKQAQDTAPTVSAAIGHIRQIRSAIEGLLHNLELMPENFNTLATVEYLKLTGEEYYQVESRMTTDLRRYMAVCDKTIQTMKSWPSTKGETPKYLQHKLLARVAEILTPYSSGVEDAAEQSANVLRAAGIKYIPVSKERARADILAYERKTKNRR